MCKVPLKRCLWFACVATFAVTGGCAGPLLRSQRLPHAEPDCHGHESRQRLRDVTRAALPYVAGPFLAPHHARTQYSVEQATIRPPHSKFHPVPTRPVFEPQAASRPPQPLGVQLVPIPDHGVTSVPHTPTMVYPDIGLPPIVDEHLLNQRGGGEGTIMPLLPPDE